jgi:hypothetical protein
MFSDKISVDVDNKIESIKEKLLDNKFPQKIHRETYLANMERNEKFEEIWLVSPDLLTEINNGVYANVVRHNLKKGTKYCYFVPRNAANEPRVEIFKKNCSYNKNLEIFYLSKDFFFLVPGVDFSIYEPHKAVVDGKQGYMGLDIQGTDDRYAFLMNEDFINVLVTKLNTYIRNSHEHSEVVLNER